MNPHRQGFLQGTSGAEGRQLSSLIARKHPKTQLAGHGFLRLQTCPLTCLQSRDNLGSQWIRSQWPFAPELTAQQEVRRRQRGLYHDEEHAWFVPLIGSLCH